MTAAWFGRVVAVVSLLASGWLVCSAQAVSAPTLDQAQADPSQAQTGSAQTDPAQAGYTFRTQSRVVLSDVTVADRDGNPIPGLKAGDFEIFDNKKQQTLSSFEEHVTQPVESLPSPSQAPGVFSNDYMMHLPPVLNIMVIDIKNIAMADQMYLGYELKRFVQQLPAGEPLAIYWCYGPTTVLLQSFTADHALLLAAVARAVPHFPPLGREYLSDTATLRQIEQDLAQVPGRKNVLWFTGGSTLWLRQDLPFDENPAYLRAVLDDLETSRIALYPIDARGLTVSYGYSMFAQQGQMQDIANATGGRAYYNNNGLDLIAAHVMRTGGSFYTLTYTPTDFRFDNKWHKVKIKLVDGRAGVTLSYRQGYFADAHDPPAMPGAKVDDAVAKTRRRLLAGGKTVEEQPDLQSQPIIFDVKMVPKIAAPATSSTTEQRNGSARLTAAAGKGGQKGAKASKGSIAYSAVYSLPADSFTVRVNGDKAEIEVNVAVIVFDDLGRVRDSEANRALFTMGLDELRRAPHAHLAFAQPLELSKGENHLLLAVWDSTSRRMGTLQFPMTAPAAH